jgi:succinate dehydrogenase / fumarate reductase, cytochrome b subunit
MNEPKLSQNQRPLSPHLQIYKLPMTAITSILHRATGAALAIGTLMLTWMLVAAAMGESAFNTFLDFSGSPLGLFMIFGWSAALSYHMCNGIRHLIWDTGAMLDIKTAKTAGVVVLIAAIALTALIWISAGVF